MRACSALLGLLGLLALLLAAAPAAAQLENYHLGPGDKVRLTVFGHPDLSLEAQIGATGEIAAPLIGQVAAAGLTVDQLETEITRLLDKDYIVDPKVVVDIASYRPIFVLGEVNSAGRFDYVLGLTVRNAIAMAGGHTRRAKEEPVELVRPDEEGKPQRFRAYLDTPVLPGDTIEVQRRLF